MEITLSARHAAACRFAPQPSRRAPAVAHLCLVRPILRAPMTDHLTAFWIVPPSLGGSLGFGVTAIFTF